MCDNLALNMLKKYNEWDFHFPKYYPRKLINYAIYTVFNKVQELPT